MSLNLYLCEHRLDQTYDDDDDDDYIILCITYVLNDSSCSS